MKAVDYLFLLCLMFVGLGAMDMVSPVATGISLSIMIILVVYKVFVGHITPGKD